MDDCFNGQKQVFYKKKKHSLCLSDLNHEENIHYTKCSCTHNDYRWFDLNYKVILDILLLMENVKSTPQMLKIKK